MINKFFLKHNNFLISVVSSTIFFLVLFLTLKDYGISWDETIHFRRGQAYLYYFLIGETDYKKLQDLNLQGTNGDPKMIPIPRRSFYQSDFHNGDYMFKNDSGHPPLNGELAALFNIIFFQKLGIMDDVSSHHIFNVLTSALLVFIVVYFSIEYLGVLAGLITFLSLVTYPLFFAESHFNVKDPPETAFFAATILSLILSIERKNHFWVLVSAIFFGLGLGTKFNILFAPLIVIPYLIYRYIFLYNTKDSTKILSKKYCMALLLSPVIIFIIFYFSWPYLWQDSSNILNILGYYKDIGIGTNYQPENFIIGGFNLFPILWIIYTTPPITLIFFIIGLISIGINRKKFKGIAVLWLIWFLVPILRVTLPGTTIYGGIRQILEFLPAMVLIVGLGAWQIISWAKLVTKNTYITIIIQIALLVSFLWPIYILINMHPHQNVYFNFLTGGLKGAKEQNFPSWGNSFGNAYKEGINWINKNVEYGAKLALIQGTPANAPAIFLRKDIDYKNSNWSGFDREGEYLMELTFNDTGKSYNFAWDYVEKFLDPVYELKVEGVPILKIWKNDLEYTKPQYRFEESIYTQIKDITVSQSTLTVDLGQENLLSRIYLDFQPGADCLKNSDIFVEYAAKDQQWIREKDWIPFPQVRNISNLGSETATFYFAGKKAQFIKLIFNGVNSCILQNLQIKVIILK